MKLSSISLIATALAATSMAGSATAAPTPPFEPGDIYGHPDEHKMSAELHYHAAYDSWDASHLAKEVKWHKTAADREAHSQENLVHMRDHAAVQHGQPSSYAPLLSKHYAIRTRKKALETKAMTNIAAEIHKLGKK